MSVPEVPEITLPHLIDRLGFGRYQIYASLGKGLFSCTVGASIMLQSFLLLDLSMNEDSDFYVSPTSKAAVSSAFFAGWAISASFWGKAADQYGRRPIMLANMSLTLISTFLTIISPSLGFLLLIRGFSGLIAGGMAGALSLLAEVTASADRGRHIMYANFWWAVGSIGTICFGYISYIWFESDWRLQGFFVVLVDIAALSWYYFLIPESPVWLLEQANDPKAAESILRKMAEAAGTSNILIDVSTNELKFKLISSRGLSDGDIDQEGEDEDKNEEENDEDRADRELRPHDIQNRSYEQFQSFLAPIYRLFEPDLRKTTFLICTIFLLDSVIYYGIFLYVVELFGGDEGEDETGALQSPSFYYREIISAFGEVPGVVLGILTQDRFGRRKSQGWCLIICAISTLSLALPIDKTLLAFLSSISRMTILSALGIAYVCCPELYPTEVRGFAVGIVNMLAKVGAFVTPLVAFAGRLLPVLIFSGASIGAAIASFNIKETAPPKSKSKNRRPFSPKFSPSSSTTTSDNEESFALINNERS